MNNVACLKLALVITGVCKRANTDDARDGRLAGEENWDGASLTLLVHIVFSLSQEHTW